MGVNVHEQDFIGIISGLCKECFVFGVLFRTWYTSTRQKE